MKKLLLFLCCLLAATAAHAQVNNARMLSTPNAQTGTSYTFVAADTTRVVTFNNSSPVAVTLPNGATQGFGAGTMLSVINLGAGTVTITCSSCTISGAGTLVLSQNQGTDIYGGAGTPAVNYVALPVAVGGTIGGTIAANQVGFGSSPNNIGGSPNFQYGSSAANALNLNMPGASCTGQGSNQHSCALTVFTNSSAATPAYINKYNDNSFCLTNDDNGIPNHGQMCFLADGTSFFAAGAGGPLTTLHTSITTNSGWTFPAGSITNVLPDSGIGTAQWALGIPGSNLGTFNFADVWDTGTGCHTLYANSSTTIKNVACPPAAGSAAFLSAVQCGTVAANAACPNTVTSTAHCVSGIATLSGGSSTVTGISPAFTSSSSWFVVTNDVTTSSNVSKGVPASGSSITFTGTGTDNIAFIGCGG